MKITFTACLSVQSGWWRAYVFLRCRSFMLRCFCSSECFCCGCHLNISLHSGQLWSLNWWDTKYLIMDFWLFVFPTLASHYFRRVKLITKDVIMFCRFRCFCWWSRSLLQMKTYQGIMIHFFRSPCFFFFFFVWSGNSQGKYYLLLHPLLVLL